MQTERNEGAETVGGEEGKKDRDRDIDRGLEAREAVRARVALLVKPVKESTGVGEGQGRGGRAIGEGSGESERGQGRRGVAGVEERRRGRPRNSESTDSLVDYLCAQSVARREAQTEAGHTGLARPLREPRPPLAPPAGHPLNE